MLVQDFQRVLCCAQLVTVLHALFKRAWHRDCVAVVETFQLVLCHDVAAVNLEREIVLVARDFGAVLLHILLVVLVVEFRQEVTDYPLTELYPVIAKPCFDF